MSKLEGGIFSRPRGKTGGIVFGAARTRRGKQVTTRLLVPPSNPNTTAQVAQRNAFKDSLQLVRSIGPGVYQGAFNRVISQLPGFQSMMSLMLNNYNASLGWGPTARQTYLRGSNPLPTGIAFTAGADPVVVTWDTTPASGGLATDEVFLFGYVRDTVAKALSSVAVFSGQTVADGATGYSFANPANDDVIFWIWTVGSGANAGIYSNIRAGEDISD